MRLLKNALLAVAVAAGASASAQSDPSETSYYHCSYTVGANSFWTAVGTTMPYGAMVEQWKAFAQSKGGSSAFCFSSYRTNDAPYQSLEEVDAVGKLAERAKRVTWAPLTDRSLLTGAKPATPGAGNSATTTSAFPSPREENTEYEAAMKRYNEGLAAHEAAVDKYKSDLDKLAAQNAAAVKAAQEETARREAAYQAELERNRALQADYEAKMQALRKH
jgi:hypothetical protein